LGNLISVENINGGASTDQIVATAGDDVLDFSTGPTLTSIEEINGGSGNDTITVSNALATNYRGSAGTDTFVVTTASAESTILDFDDAGDDRIDLSNFGLSLAQIQALTTQVGADIRIDLTSASGSGGAGTGDIILVGTNLTTLDFAGTTDFIL
ncbi:MAG: hypothetical protein IT524_04500, partial [Nitrosomonas sp.]|nr:hypothetical protein [Nitrosomonas sp.]